jgi:hypothetical protein
MRSALIITTVAQVTLAGPHVIDGHYPVAIVLAFCAVTTALARHQFPRF